VVHSLWLIVHLQKSQSPLPMGRGLRWEGMNNGQDSRFYFWFYTNQLYYISQPGKVKQICLFPPDWYNKKENTSRKTSGPTIIVASILSSLTLSLSLREEGILLLEQQATTN